MLKNHTILIVDDDPLNLRLLERLLKREFSVITADDARQALEILETEPISLIITDQQMPEMSGIELLQKCREINEQMVRMMVTANRDSKTFIEAIRAAGAVRVITKPWDPDKVLKDIRAALERYALEAEGRQAIKRLKETTAQLRKQVGRE